MRDIVVTYAAYTYGRVSAPYVYDLAVFVRIFDN